MANQNSAMRVGVKREKVQTTHKPMPRGEIRGRGKASLRAATPLGGVIAKKTSTNQRWLLMNSTVKNSDPKERGGQRKRLNEE